MNNKILVVDDDVAINELIKVNLELAGYKVIQAFDGVKGFALAKQEAPSLIVLDVRMPEVDGFTVAKRVRQNDETKDIPIIMLTAKGDDMDKIMGLEYGADDYITKPFNILEVKARIKAIMRRTTSKDDKNQDMFLEAGTMKIDLNERRVYIEDGEMNLTSKEYDVLELLAKNANHVYSREKLLHLVWGEDYPGDVRTVDVHIRRLREKIEKNPSEPKFVHTKWGVGYYFKA